MEIVFFAFIGSLIWTYLIKWANKTTTAKYFAVANLVIYICYVLALFVPLFDTSPGNSGRAFAAGMMIMIASPVHLLVTFLIVLIFRASEESILLRKIFLIIGLPTATLIWGYLIAEKILDEEDRKTQILNANFQKEIEKEKAENSRSLVQFEKFLSEFTSDTVFQKGHTRLPLAIFYLNKSLEFDSVKHYYAHNWKPFRFNINQAFTIFDHREHSGKKSEEWAISRKEGTLKIDYHFKYDGGEWELTEVKKRSLK